MEGLYPVLPLSARVAPAISRLALHTFDRFIGHEYSREGREAFRRYAAPEAVRFRLESGEVAFGAFDAGELVGVLEMRGIARALVTTALGWARQCEPDLDRVTLNSSPYARPFYLHLGFEPLGPESEEHGIRSTPMVLTLR